MDTSTYVYIYVLVILSTVAILFECGIALSELIDMFKENRNQIMRLLEPLRKKNRLVIVLEWVFVWVFSTVGT